MDFDQRFNRAELQEHLYALGVLGDYDLDELLKRTTKNTRSGNEFGFKPSTLDIGSIAAEKFYAGRSYTVESEGNHPQSKEPEDPEILPSSFWFRFHEEWFQLRAFFREQRSATFQPYECRIPFRDLVAVRVNSQYPVDYLNHKNGKTEARVQATISIQSRKPASYCHYLQGVLVLGHEPIYDRTATEADFFSPAEAEGLSGSVIAVGDPRLIIHPGSWLVHRITVIITPRQYKLLWMCLVRLRLAEVECDLLCGPPNTRPMPPFPNLSHLAFATRYLVEGLLSHGTFVVPEIDDLLTALERYQPVFRERILEGLFRWTRRQSIRRDLREVARRISRGPTTGNHLVPIRRCLITPTRCLLYPPALETSNSFLRANLDHLDRILRVQFVDEDGGFPVTGEINVIDDITFGMEGVFARIRRVLEYGLRVAGRDFVFLAYSESQARDRGFWMISETGTFTVARVLEWMGDLSGERNIAKHAARRSLPLSTTRELDFGIRIERIDDVQRQDWVGRTYTFTDGAGVAHQKLLDRCARVVGYRSKLSAVQIRIGGIKGVLCAASPNSDIEEDEVRIRGSQVKFESIHKTLNIVKPASFSRATLNRQAIILLESRGIAKETLLEVFNEEKTRIENLEHNSNITRATTICTLPITKAIMADVEDTLTQNVLRVLKCRMLSLLKHKAWIEVADSAFSMGVPDETGSLQEDEIFVQIRPPGEDARVVTGPCTIYRNPCLHPGDVRSVMAVDSPALRHLENVVVFSTQGDRDLPNMLAGGDLDGDLYSVLWDPRLLIRPEMVHPPMDYTGTTPPKVDCVTQDQVKQHFVDLIKNDVLGRVCNTHMAYADAFGPESDECIKLACMASQAVDFPKTGVPVSISDIPPVEEYPDYMGKDYKTIRVFKKQEIASYESDKALGHMYRAIDPEPTLELSLDVLGDDFLQACPLDDRYEVLLSSVALHKARYDFQLMGLLRRYNISESECVAGMFIRAPKARFKIERDYDLRIAIRDAYQIVLGSAIEQAKKHLEAHAVAGEEEDLLAWALCAYQVTFNPDYSQYAEYDWSEVDLEVLTDEDEDLIDELEELAVQEQLDAQETKLLSYPWIFGEQLAQLRRGAVV